MMTKPISIKILSSYEDVSLLDIEFSKRYPWYTSNDYFSICLEENLEGKRVTLLAYYEDTLAGCCHLLFGSEYPYFKRENIPEINDLNVFQEFRRKGIASVMFDELEGIASKKFKSIGLGVGLYKDYGNAQMMYNKRGYVMDGRGIVYKNMEVKPGHQVTVDDDLLLYLIKDLGE
ncbi:GNAT family N-acetyltransferase [Paenibacillus urinalis]|uniref:GNAT family N-acetyltransferase n=1 Tax=Paenibacillus urinalis TaxID=521520 RepID=A0AAX3N5P2_9BACL|nr:MULTISPECIES: GNAT family N-acetyltransferase [Paenibacillus]WDH83962.1 GNAT family N-acetyltransferase [Paenibacillus urinalis]WDH95417.1 GNAT family N-acetyltransferase [Paenibacillus urinalis]WDI03614.1 GNAT family N-acetyltransferase [Paenibacillus urinalis]GAK40913.1 N-acetyltransferase GCN5 [Paenibacillus sp. TCA20]